MYLKCFKYKDRPIYLMVRSEEHNGVVDCLDIKFDPHYAYIAKGCLVDVNYIRDLYTEITLKDFKKAYADFLQAADVIFKEAI